MDTKQLGRSMINRLVAEGVKIDSSFDYSLLHTEYRVTLSKMYLEEASDDILAECLPGEAELGGMLAPFLMGAKAYHDHIIFVTGGALREPGYSLISSEAVFAPEFTKQYGINPAWMVMQNYAAFHRIVGEKIAEHLYRHIENAIDLALPDWLQGARENAQLIIELDRDQWKRECA